jgi:hypothetical protein
METVRIRDPGRKKVGSGINIPDPHHCIELRFMAGKGLCGEAQAGGQQSGGGRQLQTDAVCADGERPRKLVLARGAQGSDKTERKRVLKLG